MRTVRQIELLEAAVSIVAEEGFSRLTIRKVAAAVGVTEPAVYRHFSSKLDLLIAIIEDLQEAIAPLFRRIAEGAETPEDLFGGFVAGLFSVLNENPAFAPLVFSEEAFHAEPELRPLLFRMMSSNLDILAGALAKMQGNGVIRSDADASELALMTMGSIRLTITRVHLSDGSIKLADQTGRLADLLANLCRK